MMGAGKTTVGRALAQLMRWRFVDSDDQVERGTGRDRAARSVERTAATPSGDEETRRRRRRCRTS